MNGTTSRDDQLKVSRGGGLATDSSEDHSRGQRLRCLVEAFASHSGLRRACETAKRP